MPGKLQRTKLKVKRLGKALFYERTKLKVKLLETIHLSKRRQIDSILRLSVLRRIISECLENLQRTKLKMKHSQYQFMRTPRNETKGAQY